MIFMFHHFAQPVLPTSHHPKQNQAEGGAAKINPAIQPDGPPCKFWTSLLRYASAGARRISARTSSADGRLYNGGSSGGHGDGASTTSPGSVTGQIVPWNAAC